VKFCVGNVIKRPRHLGDEIYSDLSKASAREMGDDKAFVLGKSPSIRAANPGKKRDNAPPGRGKKSPGPRDYVSLFCLC